MSPVEDVDQNTPVTTTYDATEHSDLARQLHTFCTERALERVAASGAEDDWPSVNAQLRRLRILDVMYADAKRHPESTSRAILCLRTMALRDQDHAEFRPQWTPAPRNGRRRALTARKRLARIVFSR